MQWRQQQEQAALAAALQQLQPCDAVPKLLQAGLQRVLLCVRHTLSAVSTCSAGAAPTTVPGVDVGQDQQHGIPTGAVEPEPADLEDGREAAAAAVAAAQLRALAAQVCARLPRPAAAKGQDAALLGGPSATPWLGDTYVPALLHHYLLLSTSLLEDCGGVCRDILSGSRSPPASLMVVARDGLAAAAAGQAAAPLPVGVYGCVAAALGWQQQLLDLLAWMPDGEVAAEVAARVMAAAPALAPGMAAALLRATSSVDEDDREGGMVAAGLLAAPPSGARRLAGSPRMLLQLAATVRGAAAQAVEGAAEWLPCLVVLTAALTRALAEGPTASAAATRGADTWAAEACAALQEALCSWQEQLIVAEAGSASGEASSLLPLLLPPLRDGLLPLLDEHARQHMAAHMEVQVQGQQQGQGDEELADQQKPLLLPYALVIQLRSRISLFAMAAAAAEGSSATAEAPSCSVTVAKGSAAAIGDRDATTGGPLPAALLSAVRSAAQQQSRSQIGTAVNSVDDRCAGPAAVVERVAAVAVALLTPGMASWLVAVREPRALAAAGPDPFSPFRLALALLELLQGGVAAAESLAAGAEAEEVEAGAWSEGRWQAADGGWRRLELQVLRLAVECVAGVEAAEQQAALQAVAVAGSTFARLQSRLAADASLQSAAGRGLVALSNRTAAVRGSLEATGRALSAAAEAQHLAAAAREMLPYAVLAPATCVRRLVLDGLLHPGQQPWVLQLLRSLAATATAPAAGAAEASAAAAAACSAAAQVVAAGGASVLMTCLREVMQDAPRLLRTGGDRRALLALVEGLARAGVAPPRQVLSQLVTPLLQVAAAAGVDGDPDSAGGQLQLLAALQLAQHLLGLPGTPLAAPAASIAVGASASAAAADAGGGGIGGTAAVAALAPAWSPAAELAAAQPAVILLAAAAVLQKQYVAVDASGRADTAVLEATGSVLERTVELYGAHVRAVLYGAGGGAAMRQQAPPARQQLWVLRELQALARGVEVMPMRVVSVLVPVLEAASPHAQDGAEDDDTDGDANPDTAGEQGSGPAASDAAHGSRDATEVQLEAVAAGLRAQVRALAARVAAPAAWRPRALRSANTDAVQALLLPVLAFAAANPFHTSALHAALIEAAADADAADHGEEHVRGDAGALARHVAATAARGVSQLPEASLRDGLAAALAALLPTATVEQARRLLLALAPPLLLQLQTGGRGGLAALLCSAATPGTQPAGAGAQAQAAEVQAAVQAAAVALAPVAAVPPSTASVGMRSAVAASLILTCGAAIDMLTRAAAGSAPRSQAAEAGGVAAAADDADGTAAGTCGEAVAGAVAAASDRCTTHLALLTSRLVAVPPLSPGLAPMLALFFIHLSRVVTTAAAASAAGEQPSAGRWLDVWQLPPLS
eukprot:XP_001691260.1 predicted protein [Chlamydomonas reinhardtii]